MLMQDIIEAIESGRVDGGLDTIRDVISDRRSVLGRRKHRSLNVGDVVVFVNLGAGAKYMNGLRARILEINPKTVWVSILPEDRATIRGTRFGRSSRIKVYPGNIELAFVEGQSQAGLPHLSGGMKNVHPLDES